MGIVYEIPVAHLFRSRDQWHVRLQVRTREATTIPFSASRVEPLCASPEE